MPTTTAALNTANLALCGFPFTAGFYSKDSIIETFILTNSPITTGSLCIMRAVLTAAYSTRLSVRLLWNPYKGLPHSNIRDNRKTTYFAYAVLMTGALTRGAFLTHFFHPVDRLIILPLPLKMLTLRLVLTLAIL